MKSAKTDVSSIHSMARKRKKIVMDGMRRTKELLKEAFPSMWLRWHFGRRPKSAERELNFLNRVVPKGAVTIDVGANFGLYTRELARLSQSVYAFEPSRQLANLLRRTSAANVKIHEIALSDHSGEAELLVPQGQGGPVHGLASIESRMDLTGVPCVATKVPTARLDEVVKQDVAFVKIDVEGHELSVLNGAVELLERCHPIFLVEAEDRHRAQATQSIFEFFRDRAYNGFFLKEDEVLPVEEFRTETLQDASALLPDGGRKTGRCYVNNFFFFPSDKDGMRILSH
jgi:FkbM family methyltransferase